MTQGSRQLTLQMHNNLAAAKGGFAPLTDVYLIGAKTDKKGSVFIDSPGAVTCRRPARQGQ